MSELDRLTLEELVSLEALGAAHDPLVHATAIAGRLGLTHLCYHSPVITGFSHQDPLLVLTYSAEWVQHYKRRGYVNHDPAVMLGMRSVLPVNWSAFSRRQPLVGRIYGEARESGIGPQGLTIPVRGPTSGLWALVSGSSDESERDWRGRWPELVRDAVVLANVMHHMLVERHAVIEVADFELLTKREIEALQWAAEGKTTEDIGVIMHVGRETARAHLDSARHKLGALNRAHAIVKAFRAGLIS